MRRSRCRVAGAAGAGFQLNDGVEGRGRMGGGQVAENAQQNEGNEDYEAFFHRWSAALQITGRVMSDASASDIVADCIPEWADYATLLLVGRFIIGILIPYE